MNKVYSLVLIVMVFLGCANVQKKSEDRSIQNKQDISQATGILAWPVPKNKIISYFHDQNYPYKNIIEHYAIDIKAAQGTTVKAAASGYVVRSEVIGPSYGYIMIMHNDSISTIYGHVSKSFVKKDDYVIQGQTIGLSGGKPGTVGAGSITSGPHLHFEVRKGGIPVNPLTYLSN